MRLPVVHGVHSRNFRKLPPPLTTQVQQSFHFGVTFIMRSSRPSESEMMYLNNLSQSSTYYTMKEQGNKIGVMALGGGTTEYSIPNTDTAVVFIHGFLGDAYGTWIDFQRMIDGHAKVPADWNLADLFFVQ